MFNLTGKSQKCTQVVHLQAYFQVYTGWACLRSSLAVGQRYQFLALWASPQSGLQHGRMFFPEWELLEGETEGEQKRVQARQKSLSFHNLSIGIQSLCPANTEGRGLKTTYQETEITVSRFKD